jgi:hypothetical protein
MESNQKELGGSRRGSVILSVRRVYRTIPHLRLGSEALYVQLKTSEEYGPHHTAVTEGHRHHTSDSQGIFSYKASVLLFGQRETG